MSRLHIHVLTLPQDNSSWLEECLRSIPSFATVSVIHGIDGDVAGGRAIGYAQGDSEYVGYIDSDDYVLPLCYELSLEYLEKHPATPGVYCREYELTNGGLKITDNVVFGHHGRVYRRKAVEPFIPALRGWTERNDKVVGSDMWLASRIQPVGLDHVGYVWRKHGTQLTSKG